MTVADAHGSEAVPHDGGRGLAGRLARRWPELLGLTVVWIALWGTLSPANVLSGLAVAVAVMAFADQVQPRPVHHFRVVPALRYLVLFARQLVLASVNVALAVARPERIKPGIVAIEMRYCSDAVVTLVANSITLTPGTMTLETQRSGDTAVLYVHALDLSDESAVRDDVVALERAALAAFAGADAQLGPTGDEPGGAGQTGDRTDHDGQDGR